MVRFGMFFVATAVLGSQVGMWTQENAPGLRKKLADGVYAVQRDSLRENDVLPLKNNEVLAIHQHRYLKKDDKEPSRFLVVRSSPEVALNLSGEPKVVKEGTEVVRILVTLQPKAAADLEQLTRNNLGRQGTIILGGEVVTMHKIRQVIKGGEVQITNCAPGAAAYLVKQLSAHLKDK